jgi:hypothetical protein
MATSPRPYQNNFKKDSKSQNLFKKRKDMVLAKEVDRNKKDKIILWNTFFRRNPHRFCETYLGIKLYPYQIIWIYLMSISDVFVSICSRAAAKSYLLALFGAIQCILYPMSEIVIGSSTLKQAGIIIEKLNLLKSQSQMLLRELAKVTTNPNSYDAIFNNGSIMHVVVMDEKGRGNRATMLILEEFRLLKKEIVDSIFVPFLAVRQVPFKFNKEYIDYPVEEPRRFSISSAGFKSEWWYRDTINTIKAMLDGKRQGFFCTDYLVSVFHGIKTKNQMETERQSAEELSFSMEYENIPAGQSGKAYFKLNMFPRTIKRAFYPLREDLISQKKNPYAIPKKNGEIRVVSVDIATRANVRNDSSIISCGRLLPTHKGYDRHIVYMESSRGENVISQALRIKNVFFDFESDYLVLDIAQNGIAVFDAMSSITKDEERDIEYPAFTIMDTELIDRSNTEDFVHRTLGIDALPVVFPISGTPKLNNDIAVAFRTALQKKLFHFLCTDVYAEDYLIKNNKEYLNNSKDDFPLKSWFLHPHIQINLTVMECINLEMKVLNSMIKLDEGNGRKDRYTSVSYMNYFVTNVLDRELLRENDDVDDFKYIVDLVQVV